MDKVVGFVIYASMLAALWMSPVYPQLGDMAATYAWLMFGLVVVVVPIACIGLSKPEQAKKSAMQIGILRAAWIIVRVAAMPFSLAWFSYPVTAAFYVLACGLAQLPRLAANEITSKS